MPRREQLEEMLRAEPDDVFLNYALGLALVNAHDPAAGAQLQRVIQLDPNYVAAYFQLAQFRAEEDEIADARRWVTEGIAVARKVGDAHALSEMTGFLATLGDDSA